MSPKLKCHQNINVTKADASSITKMSPKLKYHKTKMSQKLKGPKKCNVKNLKII